MDFCAFKTSDQRKLSPYLERNPFVDNGFTALYYTADSFGSRYALLDQSLVVSFDFPDRRAYVLFGTGDIRRAADELCVDGRVQFIMTPEEDLDAYRNLQGYTAKIATTPGYADYLCSYEDFVSVDKRVSPEKYKDYNRFIERNAYSVREITSQNISDAKALMSLWCSVRDCGQCQYGCEKAWIERLLDAWSDLPAKGLIVDIDGQPQAFCIAERCGPSMRRLVGKPVGRQRGLHVFMGVETARRFFPDVKTVNSGPDSDLPGLAIMKQKFRPYTKVEKYIIDLEKI